MRYVPVTGFETCALPISLCGSWSTPEDLPSEVRQESQSAVTGGFKLPAEGINFEEVEKNLNLQAMDSTDYNITKAAKLLGLTFRTLQYRLEKFGIKRTDGKEKETTEE